MSQNEINEREWRDPENWSGPKWFSIYFSKRDSRLWVPKQIPSLGWTINFGHPRGGAILLAIIIGIILFVIVSNIVVRAVTGP